MFSQPVSNIHPKKSCSCILHSSFILRQQSAPTGRGTNTHESPTAKNTNANIMSAVMGFDHLGQHLVRDNRGSGLLLMSCAIKRLAGRWTGILIGAHAGLTNSHSPDSCPWPGECRRALHCVSYGRRADKINCDAAA